MNKAFFIDKDGTLVDNSKYPYEIPSDNLLTSDVIEGLFYLKEKGYKLLIISNQSWIAKGRMTYNQVTEIFEKLLKKLNILGIKIDGYYFCPHKSSDNCNCRKPKTGLVMQAVKEHSLNLQESFFVGDMEDDILTGKNSKIKTILVKTGCGKDYFSKISPDYTIKNINEIRKIV
ncbi:MAG: HAD-IIIA family hydrolase [Nanoarchaeota archaeon]|nr:HAD-IIIA family hydrolase [Nanoarchaeota archaeon]MBU1632076.1 HAD-IIIA family hydrolase [Nanoarchaeota archaeon]MBU1875710.1 HAD-IIIA family hydrolase [Nanoarchaeota archaeon]